MSETLCDRCEGNSVCIYYVVSAAGDCSGTWVRWWHWYQAAVAIVTVDIIAAICFLVMVIVILLDNDTTISMNNDLSHWVYYHHWCLLCSSCLRFEKSNQTIYLVQLVSELN